MGFFSRLLLLSAVLLSFITVISAQKVTLSYQHAPLETVLNSVKQQTKLSLVFSEQLVDINRPVSIHVSKIEVNEALNQLFAGTNVDFEIKNDKLYLVERKLSVQEKSDRTIESVSGMVVDEKGDPVIGASVLIKNSSVGTITDFMGKFVLNVSEGDMLIISYSCFALPLIH